MFILFIWCWPFWLPLRPLRLPTASEVKFYFRFDISDLDNLCSHGFLVSEGLHYLIHTEEENHGPLTCVAPSQVMFYFRTGKHLFEKLSYCPRFTKFFPYHEGLRNFYPSNDQTSHLRWSNAGNRLNFPCVWWLRCDNRWIQTRGKFSRWPAASEYFTANNWQ